MPRSPAPRSSVTLTAFVALVAFAAALAPPVAHASGTLGTSPRGVAPTAVRVAIATDGVRTTRWQMAVLPPGERIAWLVPARPGAAIDLAGDPFFAALDEATQVRVLRPVAAPSAARCGAEGEIELVRDDTPTERATPEPGGPVVLTSAAELTRFAADRGLYLAPGFASLAFQDGSLLIAIVFAPGARPSSTPVLRVSDDGPAALPLFLTRATSEPVPVTAWVVGAAPAQFGAPVALAGSSVVWGERGSNYRAARDEAVAAYRGFGFLTEAASHDLVFGPLPTLPNGEAPRPLARTFAERVTGTPAEAVACAGTLERLRNAPLRFGVVCPAGVVGRLPGGAEPCTPSPGDVDPALASCGTTDDDLALALSGKRVDALSVTRAYGLIPAGGFGVRVGYEEAVEKWPFVESQRFDPACLPAPPPGATSASPAPTSGGRAPSSREPQPQDEEGSYESSGCGGGSAIVIDSSGSNDTGSSDDSCSSDSSGSSDDSGSSDSGCGGDTVGGDNDGSGDACASDSSSSSSSDTCSGDSGSSDSGCDSGDASLRRTRPRGKSPVSRAALALFALALPLRRLFGRRDL